MISVMKADDDQGRGECSGQAEESCRTIFSE